MKAKINVSIVGASGYAGGELIRILLDHPMVTIKQVTSEKFARFPVTVKHPNLRKRTELKFSKLEALEKCDLLFVSLPNGLSQSFMKKFLTLAPKVIDLGADFRLSREEDYVTWYGDHKEPNLLSSFTYGIAELHRQAIKNASYVACGGCEATCAILALYPIFKHFSVEDVIIDTKIGSSASGGDFSLATHHPERSRVVRSYKPTMHRHTIEIEQELSLFSKNDVHVHLSATAIEMVRGILTTCHVFLSEDVSQKEILAAYASDYSDESFIRVITDKIGIYRFPEPKILEGTNFCDIGIEKDKRSKRVVIVAAIDNLVKGTAGQAIQAMNIMFGFTETTGLLFTGLHPI